MITCDEMYEVLKVSWGVDTAYNGIWSADNPSLNQCAVTALIAQDFFAGKILCCPTEKGGSHYYNRISGISEIDFTKDQFQHIDDCPIRARAIRISRQYLLSYPDTVRRYAILLQRVSAELEKWKNDDGYI